MAAASIYLACRESTVHVGLKELARMLRPNASARSIGKCYRLLVRGLNILLPDSTTETEKWILKIAQATGKSEAALRLACKMINITKRSGDGTAGKHPAAAAAAALYLACLSVGESLSQDEAADAASVTPVAVRHSIKSLRPLLLEAVGPA